MSLFLGSRKCSSFCQHTQFSAHRSAVHQEEVDPYPIKYVCTVETENRFLPTSLGSSVLNVVLELYIIIRSLSLTQPRMKLTIVQNARIVQAGSLLFFDLLVAVPNTTYTAFVGEFIPFSVGALVVLGKHNPCLLHS